MFRKLLFLLYLIPLSVLAGSACAAFAPDENLLIYYDFEGNAYNSGSLGSAGDGTELSFSTNTHYVAGGKTGLAFAMIDTTTQTIADCNEVKDLLYKMDADLDGNCRVNMVDFAIFAMRYLDSGCIGVGLDFCDGADLDWSEDVAASDLTLFTED